VIERINQCCNAMRKSVLWSLTTFLIVATISMMTTQANAQAPDIVLHVDIDNGSTSGDGLSWNTATKFLQDALMLADGYPSGTNIEIWVAAAFDGNDDPIPYRPDQGTNYTLGDQTHAFELRNNVTLLGGFPDNPHNHNGNPATIDDRDPELYITILSGDLEDDDEFSAYDSEGELDLQFPAYSDNSNFVVVAVGVNSSAVLDGFTIEGGVSLHSAQPRFRDCRFQLHEGAAVRCAGASLVAMYRCAFPAMPCYGIQITEQSRLVLIDCDAVSWQRDGHVTVSLCSSIWLSARDEDDSKNQMRQ